MEDQKQHLLHTESATKHLQPLGVGDAIPRPWINRRLEGHLSYLCASMLLNIILAIASLALMKAHAAPPAPSPHSTSSPAAPAIRYEVHHEHATDHHKYSRFSGPPSSENNRAWASLVEPTFFSATVDEMIFAGESVDDSTELAEGEGYLAALGVYHEIHCLRRMRFLLYRDTYYPNITAAQQEYLESHLDHCIETLRISLMCSADISLYTFRWQEPQAERPSTKTASARHCVDWKALDDWSRSRAVDLDPRLKRPDGSAENIHM